MTDAQAVVLMLGALAGVLCLAGWLADRMDERP